MRVRFAPSPTGYLHVGGGRTALFNWLWARKHGGTFILRIEDTDRERSNDENTKSILEGLDWLGLHWDEGPHFQSDGIERHVAVARQLLAEGKAYRSFLTPEELEAQRKQAEAEKRTWLRDLAGRDRSPDESDRLAGEGKPFAIRFRVPEGVVRFDDAVYGAQQRSHNDIEDFALLRPDGTPLYNHVVVCDDVHMSITDIIRGQDHLSNTHKQVLLYQAMGKTPPSFAHLPLINAPDRTKLSKRKHGPVVSVTTYRDRGFLPEAFRNFLVLLGWSAGDDREIYSTEELIQAFTLEGISRSSAILTFSETDPRQWTDRKALHINQQYIANTPLAEMLPKVEQVLRAHGLLDEAFAEGGARREWFAKTVDMIRPRFISMNDFAEAGRAYFDETFDLDSEAVDKNLKTEPRLREWLPELAARFEALETFDHATADAALRAYAEELGVKAGVLINASRTAVTGAIKGASLFEILECLGRERVARRLRAAAPQAGEVGMKHLGILAHSSEGAALCFRSFCLEGYRELGAYDHPDVTVDCIAMARCMMAWEAGDHDEVRGTLALSIERLARADAEFFVCPDNTAHIALERPGPELALPGLHIAEVVADRAARDGRRRVGVLGTRFTMDGPVYPGALGRRGIASEVPDAEDRATVHRIIFDELVHGVFTDDSRREYVRVIERLADRGCDAVALVCTEIPLLVTPDVSPLPSLDSTRLLARAAFEVAVGSRPWPTWRGGAIAR